MTDKAYKIGYFLFFLFGLTACSGNRGLETQLSPDPMLHNTSTHIVPTQAFSPLSSSAQPSPQGSPIKPIQQSSQSIQAYQGYIDDLSNLGVIDSGLDLNAPITRREYLRWLFKTNNRFYGDQPSLQIRPANASSFPLFKDVPTSDPDYSFIQGLAEAGIIPSILTKDNSSLLLRPDLPLTRESMILWKVPLDYRKPFPLATLDSIKSSFGFSDSNLIDAKAWKPLYVDFQNGDASNLRRAFGYTLLMQPKKNLSRAQALATLWSFGFQDGALNANDVLKKESLPSPSISPSASPNVLKKSP